MSIDNATSQVLLLKGIRKRYGHFEVLRGVDLAVAAGEVVGLVGDNGAGKSTLVKIISGYLRPTSGDMLVQGQKMSFTSPRDARRAGIETVYQDLAIVKEMSLWRNFFLGKELVRQCFPFRVLKYREMKEICAEQLLGLGLTSVKTVDETARTLSGGECQTLAITRSVFFQSKVLVLDEPVAALSVRETRRVMDEIRHAKNAGLGVVYIDHNMNHVLPVADRVAVVQHGRIATVIRPSETTAAELSDIVAQADAPRDDTFELS